jgi:hypothetical protein
MNRTSGFKFLRASAWMAALLLSIANTGAFAATPLGTTFTYQGRLTQSGNPVNGSADFQMSLWDGPGVGSVQVGNTLARTAAVAGGTFTVDLNFGVGVFNGDERWLEIAVRFPSGGAGSFTTLTPRQRLNASPYALALPGMMTRIDGTTPTIIGGFAGNSVPSSVIGATISGGGSAGQINAIHGDYGTISGGADNSADGIGSTVSGGSANSALGGASTVGGGVSNIADGSSATVGGGAINTIGASANFAVIAGGSSNFAGGISSTVAGGSSNTVTAAGSTVGGGVLNSASGLNATVAGGNANLAQGSYSFAAGRRAKADANGSFVWGDSTNADIFSGGTNTFNVRASGGTAFYSNSASTTGVLLAPGGGSWSGFSDRAGKSNILPVNPRAALQKVVQLPISTWNYNTQDESIRHIGPMAQDFFAAFRVGEDDRHITSIDADGVALAAIQGLHQTLNDEVSRLRATTAAQAAELAGLKAQLCELRAVIQAQARMENTTTSSER